MISKEQLSELFEGKLDALSNELQEKAENKIAGIVGEISEAILTEMTPGHKAMMAQHLDNVDVVDYTDEFGKPTKPKKTQDPRIKNIKRPDDRDAYNQLDDFKTSKSGKNTNFVGKTYTTNERALRAEEIEIVEGKKSEKEYQDKISQWGAWKMKKAQDKDNNKRWKKERAALKTEEVEPLEELSKATLGRYADKASRDTAGKAYFLGKDVERHSGITNRLAQDEIKNQDDKILKRQKYTSKAINKLTKKD